MKVEIKNRYNGEIIICGEYKSIRDCLEKNKGKSLSEANLCGANLSRANLYGANLYGAYLYGAYLYGANLSRANLYGANLYGAYLSRANLSGADLSEANLCGANLYGADLRGANLSGAHLYGEKVTKSPIQILGLRWGVLILERQIKIGCEIHDAEKWETFEDSNIEKMNSEALVFWKVHKPLIMGLWKAHVGK